MFAQDVTAIRLVTEIDFPGATRVGPSAGPPGSTASGSCGLPPIVVSPAGSRVSGCWARFTKVQVVSRIGWTGWNVTENTDRRSGWVAANTRHGAEICACTGEFGPASSGTVTAAGRTAAAATWNTARTPCPSVHWSQSRFAGTANCSDVPVTWWALSTRTPPPSRRRRSTGWANPGATSTCR